MDQTEIKKEAELEARRILMAIVQKTKMEFSLLLEEYAQHDNVHNELLHAKQEDKETLLQLYIERSVIDSLQGLIVEKTMLDHGYTTEASGQGYYTHWIKTEA